MTLKEYSQKVDEALDQARKEGLIDNWKLTPEEQEELAKKVVDTDWFKDAMKEFEKGFLTAAQWGIKAYSLDKETGKVKALTLEEALELKDNPNYEVVSIQDYSPEEVMKQFAEHLTPEERESLTKLVLNIPSDATWNVYLIKNDLVKGTGQSLQDLKYVLFYLESIRIERQEDDSWKVIHYNRDIYVDKTPKELFGYTNEWTKDEVFDNIDTKSLARRLGYKITRDL